jgi:CheY-like chemotaxis protein
MPKVDGITALTSDAMLADRERCLEAGMDAYVAKPVRSGGLSAALEQAVPSAPVPQPG